MVGVDGPDEPSGGGDPFEQAVAHPLLALVALALFLGIIALVNWVSWRFSRFRVGGGQVELRQGALFRQHRQVRLERVQAVELSRPLLARALGLARVVVQSAGGSDSTLTLSFLDLGRAEALREHLLDLAGRNDEVTTAGPDAVGAPAPYGSPALHAAPRPVLEVPNGRLFVATILHGSTIFLGSLVAFGLLGAGVRSVGPFALAGIPALLPVAIGIAWSRFKELLTHGNFHLADAGTGVRVQEGLTDLRTTTIPIHRIQALELVQPLWWRPVGWWRIRVNVAGSGGQGENEGHRETTLLPVGTLADATSRCSRCWRPACPRRPGTVQCSARAASPRGAAAPPPPAGSTRCRGGARAGPTSPPPCCCAAAGSPDERSRCRTPASSRSP